MDITNLNAISPVDGRYWDKVNSLSPFFSEYGLIKFRLFVEIEYLIALVELPLPQLHDFPLEKKAELRNIFVGFDEKEALRIKEIESITNHDVKAVEYYLKEHLEKLNLSKYKEFVHFGLTSQDINNTSIPLSLKLALEQVYIPFLEKTLLPKLKGCAEEWENIPMLAKTHGQPASPTRLGKEVGVFVERIEKQLKTLKELDPECKFGGATGNFNAHYVAFPDIDWIGFANSFCEKKLKLKRQQLTTQIEHYDQLAATFHVLSRINTILMDFSRDFWTYISMDYFKQKIRKGEVGSSAMPHKVNPIDFENAEGNFGLANAIFTHLAEKLPVSRLQRDLTDSTVTRNIGVPLSHSYLAFKSLEKGLNKLIIREDVIRQDLENNYAVLAEAIQTVLRSINYPAPYEKLKELTRTGEKINSETIASFIDSLDIEEPVKERLRKITPFNYTGKN